MKLMSKQRIKECNMEIINGNKVIDVSWFQTKVVSSTCGNALAYLLTLDRLKDINCYADLNITIPGYKVDTKAMYDMDSAFREKQCKSVCEKLQMFAFYKADGKHFIDLLQLIKLLGFIVYIDCPKRLHDFIDCYRDLSCKGIVEELLKNRQVQFTSEDAMQCFEDYFKDLNAMMFEQVLKSISTDTESMKVF